MSVTKSSFIANTVIVFVQKGVKQTSTYPTIILENGHRTVQNRRLLIYIK